MVRDGTEPDGNGSAGVSEAKARMRAAALALFAERGYRSTSVRDIMRACNLTPGALYAHYESKEGLLFDLIREGHVRLDEILAHVRADDSGGPPPQFARLVYRLVTYTLTNAALARVTNDDFESLPEAMRGELSEMRDRMNSHFEEVYAAGVADAVFDARHEQLTLLAVFAAASHLTSWFSPGGPLSVDDVAKWHATMALRIAMTPVELRENIDELVVDATASVPEHEVAAV